MEEIIKLFDKKKMSVLSDTLTDKKLERPTPDKVFREVESSYIECNRDCSPTQSFKKTLFG
jgi:hypothetical protein